MFDVIFKPFSILIDGSKKLSHRIFYVLFILIALFVFNDTIGFTYNLKTNNKLDQLKSLKELGCNDARIEEQTKELQNGILTRKSMWESMMDAFTNETPNLATSTPSDDKTIINWRTFSSCGIVLLFMLIILVVPFATPKENFKNAFVGVIAVELVLIGVCWLFIYFLSLVPDFDKTWMNHSLNIGVQLLFFGVLVYIGNKVKK